MNGGTWLKPFASTRRMVSVALLVAWLILGAFPARLHAQVRGLLDAIGERIKRSGGDPELYVDEKLGGRDIEKKAQNFSLKHPGGAWRAMIPEKLHPLATLALERSDMPMFCTVVAQSMGLPPAGVNPMVRATEIIKEAAERTGRVEESRLEYVSLAGRQFGRLETLERPTMVGLPLAFERWLAVNGGNTWQVSFWTTPEHRAELATEARRIMEGFKVLDPRLVNRYVVVAPIEDVDKPDLGYSTKLAGGAWGRMDHSGDPLVDFAAYREGAALTVSVLLFDEKEKIPLELLAHALLANLGFDYPGGAKFDEHPWGEDGLEIQVNREVNGRNFAYLLRVARAKGIAWLVAGWVSLKPQVVDMSHLRTAMNNVTLRPPTSPANLTGSQRRERGLAFNTIGVAMLKKNDPAGAARWCLEAFRESGDPVCLENTVVALDALGRNEEALELVRLHAGAFKANPPVAARLAFMRAKAGELEPAVKSFTEVLKGGFADDDSVSAWLDLLLRQNKTGLALAVAETYAGSHPGPVSLRWHAEMLQADRQVPRAIEVLQKLLAGNPADIITRVQLGECFNDDSQFERAGEIAEQLLGEGHHEARVHLLQGWSQMGRKRHREAKASFEKAAAREPENERIQRAVALASASIGQGSNSEIKQAIAAVEVPADLAKALDQSPALPESAIKGQPAVWLRRVTGHFFEPGKPRRTTTWRRVRVLTKEGADHLSTVETTFDPLTERIFLNRLEVRDPEGRVVARGNVDNAYVRDLDNGGIADHHKALHIQVSGVTPGCVVEYEITTEDRASSDDEGFRFERYPFGSLWPAQAEAVFVRGAPDAVRSHREHAAGLRELRGEGWKGWLAIAPAPAKLEPFSQPLDRFLPMLWLGGGEKDWAAVGKEYLKEIADRLKPDPAAAAAAQRATSGLASEREKISALARHVQKELNYKAIEFGIRARRPNSASDTLEHRYGDCKDHALLLHQMLQAAGIESRLTLVNTAWDVRPELPTLDQFNHMIVHVPSLGATAFIDCTGKYEDSTRLPTFGIWHTRPFVLDPAGPGLVDPPAAVLDRIRCERRIKIERGDALVSETVTLNGYFASSMRASLAPVEPGRRLQSMQAYLNQRAPIELREFDFENLDDPLQPAVLRLNYLVRGAAAGRDGQPALALPVLWERAYLEMEYVKDRRTPFEVQLPLDFTTEVVVQTGGRVTDAVLRELAREGSGPHCHWSMKPAVADDGGELRLSFHFEAPAARRPAAEYAACQQAWQQALRAWDVPVRWEAK